MALLAFHDCFDLGDVATGRLLAEHMAAALEREDTGFGREVVGRADEDDLGFGPLYRFAVVGEIWTVGVDSACVEVLVADPGQFEVGRRLDNLTTDLAHISVADDERLHAISRMRR